MSGGVDSSVSALLLKKQGYHVIGMFMKNWEETDERASAAPARLRRCRQRLQAARYPLLLCQFRQRIPHQVFSQFLAELKAGFTPNPDILCNREIKFKAFLEKALASAPTTWRRATTAKETTRRSSKEPIPAKTRAIFSTPFLPRIR